MNILALSRALNLDPNKPQIIAAYGAGGKTALLERLAAELTGAGARVILTTTTKIYRPRVPLVLAESLDEALPFLQGHLAKANLAALGKRLQQNKVEGIAAAWVDQLFRETGAYILVEADGAAGKPVKGYTPHEPALPPRANLIIPLIGLEAVGAPLLPETAHRPEKLAEALGSGPGEILAPAHLARCMAGMVERGAEQAPDARIIPVLNKVDIAPSPGALVGAVASALSAYPGPRQVLFTACREPEPVKFNYRRYDGILQPGVACVVLAAGAAARMGCDKLALEYRGRPVLEHTLENIAKARVGDCIVVAKPGSPWRERLAGRPGCAVVENPEFASGMAGSLQHGLAAAGETAQGILFALGDQPLVPPEVYRKLVREYRDRLGLVTGPLCRGRRGNPVLLDRRTWPLLMRLEGDAGGRKVLPLLPESEMHWIETGALEILRDLDTPADYRRLLQGRCSGDGR